MDNGLSGEEALVLAKGYARQKIEEAGGMTSEGIQEIVKEALGDTPIVLEDLRNQTNNKISTFNAESNNETTIESCADGVIKNLKLYGKTEQKQYQGYNVINTLAVGYTRTLDGLTMEVKSNTIEISGMPQKQETPILTLDITTELQKFIGKTLYAYNSSEARSFVRFAVLKEQDVAYIYFGSRGQNAEIQISGNEYRILVQFITSVNDDMLNKNFTEKVGCFISTTPNLSINDYEPYVGGIPSPNPDYPQEIKSVEKINLTITDSVKQFCMVFPNTNIEPNGTLRDNPDFGIVVVKLKKGDSVNGVTGIYDHIPNRDSVTVDNIRHTVKTVLTENAYVGFRYNTSNNGGQINVNDTQINFNNEDLNINKQTIEIIPPRPLNTIEDYRDYADVENGVWRFNTYSEDIDLHNVSETNVNKEIQNKNNFRAYYKNNVLTKTGVTSYSGLCNKLVTNKTYGWSASPRYSITFDNTRKLRITLDLTERTWAEIQDLLGIINVIYPIAEETEPIDTALLSQLRNLPTYRGCTNIIATDQDGNDITTWFLYAFDLLSWFNEVNEKLDIATDNLIQIGQIYENESINSAWAYVNSVYSEIMTDLYD